MHLKVLFLICLVSTYFYLVSSLGWPGLVRFSNTVCTTLEGFDGTCYRRSQCTDIGGTISGTCANGIGRCCLCKVQGTCGGSSSYNNTYFTNDDYPNTESASTSCSFTIVPCSSNICQVRLDFLNLILAQPDGNGNCVFDSVVITGTGGNPPIICGENSGQHMYLSVVGTNDITITISTSSAYSLGRSWNIKITQIACDCPTLAPIGCLQYYTDVSGTVSSFNYGTTINGALIDYGNGTTRPGTRQIANLNYGICVNMEPGYCGIEWSQTSDDVSFTVTNNTANVEATVGLPNEGYVGEACDTDFVVVPNPYFVNGTAVNADRFCGNAFPSVITYSKPFVLTTVTNDNELEDAANRGFSLNYEQVPCSNLAYLLYT